MDGELIPLIASFIENMAHGLFHHIDSQPTDFTLLGRQGGIRIGSGKGVKGKTIVLKADIDLPVLHKMIEASVALLYLAMLEKISSTATFIL